MSRQVDIERADRAREVLENPIFQDAFAAIEQDLIESWKNSRSTIEREDLHRRVELLSKVRTQLEATMSSGMLARSKDPTTLERVSSKVRDLVSTGLR